MNWKVQKIVIFYAYSNFLNTLSQVKTLAPRTQCKVYILKDLFVNVRGSNILSTKA